MISRLVRKRALKLAQLSDGKRTFEKLRAFLLKRHFFDRHSNSTISMARILSDAGCGARNFVHFLYQDPAFDAFDDFSDFVESISCETSESCQVRGSNPCRGASFHLGPF